MIADIDFTIIKDGNIRGNIRDNLDTRSVQSKVKQLLGATEIKRMEMQEIYNNHVKTYITVTRYSSTGQLLDTQHYVAVVNGSVVVDKYAQFCDKAKSYPKDKTYRVVEIKNNKVLLETNKANRYIFFISDVYDGVMNGSFGLTNPSKLRDYCLKK